MFTFFLKTTWSRLNFYVLGPENSDSSSRTTYIVLFPGSNSQIQVKIPQHSFFNYFFLLGRRVSGGGGVRGGVEVCVVEGAWDDV